MKMLTVSCFTTTLGLIAGISQESKHLNDTLEYDVLKGQYFESSAQQT
jgi:branched-subunit amino acid permease